MHPNPPKRLENSDLIIPSGSELPVSLKSDSPALSEIVNRSIIQIQTNKQQWILHRIGEHELYGPDYRLVCTLAEDLRLEPDEVLRRLLGTWSDTHWHTTIECGRFKDLHIDGGMLPISRIPYIEGLVVESLEYQFFESCPEINFSSFHKLKKLACCNNKIIEINLSLVPNIQELYCSRNELTNLDLYQVPNLKNLFCYENKIHDLDLTPVTDLRVFLCSGNRLTRLEFSKLYKLYNLFCQDNLISDLDLFDSPLLRVLSCNGNQLNSLDVSKAQNLTWLHCQDNKLSDLDIRQIRNLETFKYDPMVRLIQRPDQNF